MKTSFLIVALLAFAIVAAPPGGEAQQTPKIPRVGVIANTKGYEAFQNGLKELAYTEGENIALEFRSLEAPNVRLATVAAELARMKVDVIVATNTAAVLAAKQATSTIPIVMLAGDPVESGLVADLGRPEGNVTGLRINEEDTRARRIELLKEAVPAIARLAVLTTSATPGANLNLKDAERTATALAMQLQSLALRRPEDLEQTFATMTAQRADSLLVLPATLAFVHRTRIVTLAIKHKLPAMFWRREFVDIGGLMAYGPDQTALYRRAADYVSKILQGARPGDLPVEEPSKFELAVNLKTARALGLTIARSVLLLADQVVE